LLAGNIFDRPGLKLGAAVYRSLLETVALHPKKKHFKKIIQHVIKHEGNGCEQSIIDLIIFIGIQQKMPIMLGQNMKYFLQHDYPVSVHAFKDFVLFLERCKGFEEDAKRFIILTHETKNVQIDYGLLRPMFLRAIKNKTGNDVLQLFEQFRKNIKLNKSGDALTSEEKTSTLRQIKMEIYDGLIQDLLQFKAYPLC
jgi:hypothetical protein